LESSRRTWKRKLKGWGFKKNISSHDMQVVVAKGKKRAWEGKDTDFYHRTAQIPTDRIERFKRRKAREVSPNVGKLSCMYCLALLL